jgi:hypothetical protein
VRHNSQCTDLPTHFQNTPEQKRELLDLATQLQR